MKTTSEPSNRRSYAESSVEEGGKEEENGAAVEADKLSDEERPAGIPVSRRSVTFDDDASVE